MSILQPIVRSSFVAFSAPLEGVVDHFYADVRGLITIAIGVLVDPIDLALALPMRWPDGRQATRTEIAADWWNVKNDRSLAHRGHKAASRVALLRLAPADVEAVTLAKLDTMTAAVERRFPGFHTWPAPAQLAVMSLAWACGTNFAFPKCEAALRALDFRTAADECAINAKGNAGVVPRNAKNRALLLEAADALEQGREPGVLLYRI